MDIKELESFRLADAVKFHDRLNPALWTEKGDLDPEVYDKLMEIAKDFMAELGIPSPRVEDITISGSNAAYSYTPHSDLDLHILVDHSKLPDNDVYKELFNAKKTVYNDTHDIKVHGVPVELYVQDSNQPHHSLGEYSLLKKDWNKIPVKRRANFDQSATKAKYEKLGELIELAIKTRSLKRVEKAIDIVKRYRKAGLEKTGEFGPENLAYKALRKTGMVQKLWDLKNELHSNELSLEDYDPNGPPPGPEFKPTMPAGTVRVDVSDVYDWYKLGQNISNLDRVDKKIFGKGPPSTIMAFGSEPEEHKYINALKQLGLDTTDIDPIDKNQPPGMPRQAVDTTYNVNEEGVAEEISESRGSLFSWLKQQFPTWPDYVVKDFLYQQAKTITSQEQLADFLEIQKKDFGKVKWRLEKLPITLDIFTPKTQRMIKSREGGSSNPFKVPKDAERHAQQLKMIQQHGVRTEPIIVAKLNNGYDLIEGWHRTIQHLKAFPEGYTGPAWVGYGATYTSEIAEQGVAESEDWRGLPYQGPIKTKGLANALHNWFRMWETDKSVDTILSSPEAQPFKVPPKNIGALYRAIVPGDKDTNEIKSGGKLVAFATDIKGAHQFIKTIYPEDSDRYVIIKKTFRPQDFLLDFTAMFETYDEWALGPHYAGEYEVWMKSTPYYTSAKTSEIVYEYDPDKIQGVAEASGYIPSEKEKNDPRFKTALTVDVKPDSIQRNARAFGSKISRAGIPPKLNTNGKF